ncbi:MAG: AMP-binding protein [Lachnospiraceae bacterium]|nr:AMP-binding protein [Lachnospiraceae bacterium]
MWNFDEFGKKAAICDDEGRCVTYACLQNLSEEFAGLGLVRGLLLIETENSLPAAVMYLLSLQSFVVPIMLSYTAFERDLETVCRLLRPDYFFVKVGHERCLKQCSIIWQYNDYVLLKKLHKSIEFIDEKVGMLLSTSGSVSARRWVAVSYQNLWANTRGICKALDIQETDRELLYMPLQYTYSLSVLNSFLHMGGTVYLTQKGILEKAFWQAMKKYEINSLSGVPLSYEFFKKTGVHFRDFPSLRRLTQSGGALPREVTEYVLQDISETPICFYKMYGQTEATARICVQHTGGEFYPDSVGKAIPGTEVYILAEDGRKAGAPFEMGEVVCKGEAVTLGYIAIRKDMKRLENRTELYTGDMGFLDEKGYLYLHGRKDRTVKLCGVRISLEEVESRLRESGYTVICIEKNGFLYICIESFHEIEAVQTVARRILGLPASVIRIEMVERFLYLENGKVDYHSMKEGLEGLRPLFKNDVNDVICRTAMPEDIAESTWYYSHYLRLSYDKGQRCLVFQHYDFLYEEPVFIDKYVECALPVSEETLWQFFQNWLERNDWIIANIGDFCASGHWIQGRLLIGNYDKEKKQVEVIYVDEVGVKKEWRPFFQIYGWWLSSSKATMEKKITANIWKHNSYFYAHFEKSRMKREARSACLNFRKMRSAVLAQTQREQQHSLCVLLIWLELCRQRNQYIILKRYKTNQRISRLIADAGATGKTQLWKLLETYYNINRIYAYGRIADEENSACALETGN